MKEWIIAEAPTPPVYCLRCGRTPADERRDPGPCYHWGDWFEKHLWSKPHA